MNRKMKMVMVGFFILILIPLIIFNLLDIHFPPYTFSASKGSVTVEHIFNEDETYVLEKEEDNRLAIKVMVEIGQSRNLMELLFALSSVLFSVLWMVYLSLRKTRYLKMGMFLYGGVAAIVVGYMVVQFVEVYQSFMPLLEELQSR